MAGRRHRRNNGTWLPTLGTQLGENEAFSSGFGFDIPAVFDQDITTVITPITTDTPLEGDSITNTTQLVDVIGNEYFLDRIVGKLHIAASFSVDDGPPALWIGGPVQVVAGFFIARCDDANPQLPVGAATANAARDNYSPAELDTIREPWIWRRAWTLGTRGRGPTFSTGPAPPIGSLYGAVFPPTTADYGSVLDGPHIDAKTKRRIGQDDRLFFAVSAFYPPQFGGGVVDAPAAVVGWLDYRLHGQLRKARPDGKF